MENLIGLVNDLQEAFADVDDNFALDLPQIAVIGSQSAGKSSVLENIVGKDFLPRGSGIVTRRPLVLQLVHRPTVIDEYGEFLHKRQQIFTDFDAIRSEIEAETDRVCGQNKALSGSPIHLRVYSPNVVDLTLIDLPGMTKVPIGDQPSDVEHQIRRVILQYIENPNCLILAVSPANADLANSDALQLAQQVDPDGLRTIGVLTKLDLMDSGTDARAVLKNEVIPLRFGYIGVVNRSQKDIDGRKDIRAALQAEIDFFRNHPSYSDMVDRMGTTYLQKALHFHLTRHIAETLPELRTKLQLKLNNVDELLTHQQIGSYTVDYDDPYWKPKALVTSVVRFSQQCRAGLLGGGDHSEMLDCQDLSSGAKIHYIFHMKYPSLMADVEFAKEMDMKREIGYAIQNSFGIRTGIFTPDKAFDQMIRNQINRLRIPSTTLVELTSSEVNRAVDRALEPIKRFPALAHAIQSRISLFILERTERTRDAVSQLLDYEYAYINAKHEDFVGFTYAERTADRIVRERKNPGNEVVKSGWLSLSTSVNAFARARTYWFVLTPDNFAWYTDPTLQECKYRIPLTSGNLKLVDHLKNNEFSLLYDSEKQNIYKDCNRIDLTAPSYEQFDQWRGGFSRVGVFSQQETSVTISTQILNVDDPHLERQIEVVWVLIASYMRIVCRTLEDMAPKIVVRLLIKDTIEFLEQRFVAEVSRLENLDELLEEDEQSSQQRRKLQKVQKACVLALEKLRMVQIPKLDGFTEHRPVRQPDRNKPIIPPRPTGLVNAAAAQEQSGMFKRSDSVPAARRLAEADDYARPQRKATVAGERIAPKAAELETSSAPKPNRNRLSYKNPKAAANQLQKAQQQIDSGQKSTFYVS